ncbi:ATP-dependent helicase [Hoyosella sp. YIM 151337]|uniref:ATP-dependent helicase n=1 Tax=Hoyosella sp. YIM 151337 TaxID=2992742 RepID=UPI002235D256|nr:ATP-dependent DNA helicase [Hoyosella sp. YIM 151337]MCW4352263.1 ATP-dependent helicase [Hoyosella sp. YIM 151337]
MTARQALADDVQIRLVGAPQPEQTSRAWDGAAQALLERVTGGTAQGRATGTPDWAPVQVLGAAGTGKTSFIADVAVAAMAAGVDPESILVLTQSRGASIAMRDVITGALLAGASAAAPRATREPLVRTIHSYAFAILRLQAAQYGNPPPRLITSAEQDAVFRELLRGDIEDDADYWPSELRPALSLAGFASELRDLLRRSAERGLGPEDLVKMGRKHRKPAWVAAGRFAAVYEQSSLLRGSVGMEAPQATAPALDAAELVSSAVTALVVDDALLTRERQRVRFLLVDDAQHVDPQAAGLIELIGRGSELTLIAGDSDQAVFRFRGADPGFLEGLNDTPGATQIILGENRRSAPEIVECIGRLAARLPGAQPQRKALSAGPSAASGRVRVRILSSPAREAAVIADTLRRAHLHEGVPWSRMAVIVRSVPQFSAPIRRALLGAGVPVKTPVPELPLARQRASRALLLVLKAVGGPASSDRAVLSPEEAVELLCGPIGGADPLTLRRLRRGVRRAELARGGERESADILASLVCARDLDASQSAAGDSDAALLESLTKVEAEPVNRVRKVLRRAWKARERNRGVEELLWEVWRAAGLETLWVRQALRDGAVGAQADRDLDAVVALFEAAGNYVDRLPAASVSGFTEYIAHQELPAEPIVRKAAGPEAVTLLSAHAAAGSEWDVVAVAGVQEGTWPSLRGRGSVLGTDDLDGVLHRDVTGEPAVPVSRVAPILADERRLFLLACARARRVLLVTAAQSVAGQSDLAPSRFLDELGPGGSDDTGEDHAPAAQAHLVDDGTGETVLALPALVAKLRAVVCSPSESNERKTDAACQLARLAEAGVAGAHPSQWYGLAPVSTDRHLWLEADGPVSLSPSTVDQLVTCPLRWLLERHGGRDSSDTSAVKGVLVHTLAQAVAGNLNETQVRDALVRAWEKVDVGSPWYARHERARMDSMISNFSAWLRQSRTELTEAGVEVAVDGVLPGSGGTEPDVRLRGRIDRLEYDNDGRPVIVDVKTARTPVSSAAATEHAQLATYQVAAAAGLVHGEPAAPPGGARLVFVAKTHKNTGAAERSQTPLSPEQIEHWTDVIRQAASATRGPAFEARVSDSCSHCPVRGSCPAQDTGRQVTQ